jgi:HAMP domain-containing protein
MYNLIKSNLISDSEKKMEEIDNNVFDVISQMKQDAKVLANSDDIKKADNSILALFNIPNVGNNKKYSKQIAGMENEIYNNFELYALTHQETQYVCFGTKWGGYIQWPDGLDNSNYDPRQRPWYSLAMENPDEVVISDPQKVAIDTSKNITISACTTVKNASGDIVGVIAIDTSLNKLSKIVNNVKIGDAGYAFFYLKDGTILAHPNADLDFKNIHELGNSYSQRNGTGSFSVEDINKLLDEKNDNFEAIVNGSESFINVYTSPHTGWKMAAIIPKSEFTNKVTVIEGIISGITICILLLGIAFTYFVVKNITDPIRKLTNLMESVGNGDLSVRANIKTNDEFGRLSDSFNMMIKDLSSNYEELTAVHEELVATEEELRAQYDELQYNEEALRNSEERYVLALGLIIN